MTWGDKNYDGDSRSVQAALIGVEKTYPTYAAFAAVSKDGTVVIWGNKDYFGDFESVQVVRGLQC